MASTELAVERVARVTTVVVGVSLEVGVVTPVREVEIVGGRRGRADACR